MIINITGKFAVGDSCTIAVNGGDIEAVIINVVGTGPAIKIKSNATIDPAILAPSRKIVAGIAGTGNLFANSLNIKGTNLTSLLCP